MLSVRRLSSPTRNTIFRSLKSSLRTHTSGASARETLISLCPSANAICNFGNMCAIVAMGQQDMLYLRYCMLSASGCDVAFNLLQPKPLYVPALWGLVFVTGHSLMIALLLQERQEVVMSSDELDAYEECFHKHGFLPRQFKRLFDMGSWEVVPANTTLVIEGGSTDNVYYFHRGAAHISMNGEVVGEVCNTSRFLGKLLSDIDPDDPSQKKVWKVKAQTSQQCVVIRWNRSELKALMDSDSKIRAAAATVQMRDLASKLRSRSTSIKESCQLGAYRGMLQGVIADNKIDGNEKRALRIFREKHGITCGQHYECLRDVGWSPQEYEDGVRGMETHDIPLCCPDNDCTNSKMWVACQRIANAVAIGCSRCRVLEEHECQHAKLHEPQHHQCHTLKRTVTSEPVPSGIEQKDSVVTKVVGSNFDACVTDVDKHVLLFVGALHCDGCSEFEQAFAKYGQAYSGEDVSFCKIDKVLNTIPDKVASSIYKVPSVLLFKKGCKDLPIPFEKCRLGSCTADQLKAFLNEHGVIAATQTSSKALPQEPSVS